jgi:hypothetical protein
VCGFGYQGQSLATLVAWAEAHDGIVIDVRLKPWSQQAEWQRANLNMRLGPRYLWIEAWGNLRYKAGPPVALKDWEAGLKLFWSRTSGATCAVILCGCRDELACHRAVVLTRLVETGLYHEFF